MQQESPDRINNVICKIQSWWKKKPQGFDFKEKFAFLKWMDYIYACRNYNYSDILRKITLD